MIEQKAAGKCGSSGPALNRAKSATFRLAQLKGLPVSGRIVPTLIVALVMALISWPATNIVPQAGLDPSWQAGLAMAFYHQLPWGSHIDFTYGPLGFLTVPTLYYTSTALLSLTYLLLSRWALFALLLRSVRPKFPGYWSVLAAYIVGASVVALVDPADMLMGCALLVGGLALRSGKERLTTWAIVALGVLAGVGILTKFSVGLLGIGLDTILVGSTRRWMRNTLLGAGAFAVSVIALWTATGNSLSQLPLYLHLSTAIAAGFSGAMSSELGGAHGWYYAIVVLACFSVSLWLGLRSDPRRAQLCAWLMFLVFAWVALKEGFVRHDSDHDREFFGLMMVAFAAVPWSVPWSWPKLRRPNWRAVREPAFLAGSLGLAVVIGWKIVTFVPPSPFHIPSDTHGLASEVSTVVDSSRGDAAIGHARTALEAEYRLPRPFIRLL